MWSNIRIFNLNLLSFFFLLIDCRTENKNKIKAGMRVGPQNEPILMLLNIIINRKTKIS